MMKKFIEVNNIKGDKYLINCDDIIYIEEFKGEAKSFIQLRVDAKICYNVGDVGEADCLYLSNTYEELKEKIG